MRWERVDDPLLCQLWLSTRRRWPLGGLASCGTCSTGDATVGFPTMSQQIKTNTLYYGDNLDILRGYIPEESVDLIYLDPPFNSSRGYNVIFKEDTGAPSEAQIEAFEDTWHWSGAVRAYDEMQASGPELVSRTLRALVDAVGKNDVSAYLTMMTIRLVEMHRVLKSTGSLYLHCDPTASHYLKIMLDSIFGPINFRNEIIWRRSGSHNKVKRFGPIHDVILYYTKSNKFTFNTIHGAYAKGHVDGYFKKKDAAGRRYWTNSIHGAGTRNGESGKPWRGYDPTSKGRHWAIPSDVISELGIDEELGVHEKLDALYDAGFVILPPEGSDSLPTYTQYLDRSPGRPIQDIWAYQPYTKGVLHNSEDEIDKDVKWLTSQGDTERMHYQTQKPLGLLSRIIRSSSNEDDVVLDPFCGCGTAILAAHGLKRQWLGIDVTHLAINVMRRRMVDTFPGLTVDVVGEPKDITGAAELASQDKYQFQWWALDKIDALPRSGKKKGRDKGIDGVIRYFEGASSGVRDALVSVKGGEQIDPSMIRDLRGTIEREGVNIGVFVTLRRPSKEMKDEAAAAGMYRNEFWARSYQRIQILTIEEILGGKMPDVPPRISTGYATAEVAKEDTVQERLALDG